MSDMIVMDLSNYKDRFGTNVPKGRYKVVVDDAEPDKSKAGNRMVNVWFRILEGDQVDKTIVDRLMPEGKAQFRMVGFLQAIGIKTPKKKIQFGLSQIIGKVLEIDVEDGKPYNGRVKTEVRGYLPLSKSTNLPLLGSDAGDLPVDDDVYDEGDSEYDDDYADDAEEAEGDDYAEGDDGDDGGDTDDYDDAEEAEEEATEEAPEEEPEPTPVRKARPAAAKAAPAKKRRPAPEPVEDEDDGTLDLDDLDLD